jgi:hypothetical protein
MIDLKSLNAFLNRLTAARAQYTIRKARPEAVMVLVATSTARWEVEFMTEDWGRTEVERYRRLGPVAGAEALAELWDRLDLSPLPLALDSELNGFLNRLDAGKVAYEVFKRDMTGPTVRVYSPGQYLEATFMSDGLIAIERFESRGEIKEELALNSLWDSLETERDHP